MPNFPSVIGEIMKLDVELMPMWLLAEPAGHLCRTARPRGFAPAEGAEGSCGAGVASSILTCVQLQQMKPEFLLTTFELRKPHTVAPVASAVVFVAL